MRLLSFSGCPFVHENVIEYFKALGDIETPFLDVPFLDLPYHEACDKVMQVLNLLRMNDALPFGTMDVLGWRINLSYSGVVTFDNRGNLALIDSPKVSCITLLDCSGDALGHINFLNIRGEVSAYIDDCHTGISISPEDFRCLDTTPRRKEPSQDLPTTPPPKNDRMIEARKDTLVLELTKTLCGMFKDQLCRSRDDLQKFCTKCAVKYFAPLSYEELAAFCGDIPSDIIEDILNVSYKNYIRTGEL